MYELGPGWVLGWRDPDEKSTYWDVLDHLPLLLVIPDNNYSVEVLSGELLAEVIGHLRGLSNKDRDLLYRFEPPVRDQSQDLM